MAPTVPADVRDSTSAGRAPLDADSLLRQLAGRVPLLSREEEQVLARRVEAGDERARQTFIEANIRLVVSIARGYARPNVPVSDLIQEGIIGLIQAVDHFDWRKGTRFSTCATLWIRQSICRALPTLRHGMKIPTTVLRDAGRLEKIIDDLAQQLQHRPTAHDLEAQLADDLETVEVARKLPFEPLSLDAGDDERRSLLDGLTDDADDTPEESALNQVSEAALQAAMATLSERERRVLALRFGLGHSREHTLGEIGDALGLSRQRVKQIEGVALDKLRRAVDQERKQPRWIG